MEIIVLLLVAFIFLLSKMLYKQKKTKKRHLFIVNVFEDNKKLFKIKGENLMLELKDTQYTTVTIAPINKRGNPAPVENVVWETDNPELIAVTVPDPEHPETCQILANGPVGVCTVTVTADVNMDPEVAEPLSDFFGVEIKAGQATSLGFTFGEPQEQNL